MFFHISRASDFVGLSKLISIAVLFFAVNAGSANAQSLNFDLPTPMASNRAEGVLPKGKAIAHYYSFTAGPGEVIVSFSYYSESSEWVGGVGGQLTDAYGRAFTNLDAKQNDSNKSAVTGDFDHSGTTLVGRYSIPRRQKLVIKVFTQTFGIDNDAPVRYRVRFDSGEGSSGGASGAAAAPTAPNTSTGPESTAARSTTPKPTSKPPASQRAADRCIAEYIQCTRAAIITKTGVGVCIVRKAYCLKNAGI
ncbi:MAG TPA: hypothetical protein VHL50_05560, partial [Pyrinomonadaceae bacterium]|nr:hypothetical protein [Pyrinomonadaceae bacterium]